MIRAVAWDIDGTLVDSEPTHHEALMRASAPHGVAIERNDARFIGVAMDEVWQALAPLFPAKLTREVWLQGVTDAYVLAVESLVAFPGAIEAVTRLREAGVRQVCVSNSVHRVVEANLAQVGILDAFEFVVAREDVAIGKPDPAPYALACRRLGLKPEEVLAVEDSDVGAASASAAGLKVMRVEPGVYEAVVARFVQ